MAILGTGSVYMARKDGEIRSIGGWGFQVGDHGSGARLGRDLLEETLLAHDGIHPSSPLTDEHAGDFRNNPEDVVEFATDAKPGDFGGFAPKVFEHAAKGDTVANCDRRQGGRRRRGSACACSTWRATPLCLLGGLAPLYAPRLSAALSGAC